MLFKDAGFSTPHSAPVLEIKALKDNGEFEG